MVPPNTDAMDRLTEIPKELQETLKERTRAFGDRIRAAAERADPTEDDRAPVHVVPQEGRWEIVSQGSEEIERTADTKDAAVDSARRLARSRETHMVVHRTDGTIQQVHNYR